MASLGSADGLYRKMSMLDKKFKKLSKKKWDMVYVDIAREISEFFLATVIPKTPIDTGKLRKGWTGGSYEKPRTFAKSMAVERSGDAYITIIDNDVEYAISVEFGHTTMQGAYIPPVFMTLNSADITRANVKSLVERKYYAELRKVFK